jgi:hypothetical protein
MSAGRRLAVVRYARLNLTRPTEAKPYRWPDLARLLTEHEERMSYDGPLWSPVRLKPKTTRKNENVVAVSCLVFEWDGVAPDFTGPLFKHTHAAHTTHNHQQPKDGKPAGPRYRAVFPLTRDVPIAEWKDFWARAHFHLAPTADPVCKDPGRGYFLPSHRPGKPHEAWQWGEAGWLDPDTVPPLPPGHAEEEEPLWKSTGPLPDGTRRKTYLSIVGRLVWEGLTLEQVVERVQQVNRERGDPPWPDEKVRALCEDAVPRYANKGGNGDKDDDHGNGKGRGPTQATRLVGLASEAELFHTQDDDAYATVAVNGHRETHKLRTRAFRRWLQGCWFAAMKTAVGHQAIEDTLGTLEARAIFNGSVREVHVRLVEHEGMFYLDLANDQWRAVKITPAGWEVITDPPVRFRRPRGMRPLPVPVRGGTLNELRRFVNVEDEAQWRLLVACLIAALHPHLPYPVLVFLGEPGSAKTTMTEVARTLLDPNAAPLREPPANARDLLIAATNGWVVALDNLSSLPDWLSNALCRLSTGGGGGGRMLYTDDEEVLFDAQRPVMLNGIANVALRPDLLDRCVLLNLPYIPEEQDAERRRQADRAFWTAFTAAHPRILGALLDAVCGALTALPTTTLPRLPRMADFALWATAAEAALGWPPGAFMEAYDTTREDAHHTAIEASLIGPAVCAFAVEHPDGWTGPSTTLLNQLERHYDLIVEGEAGDPLARLPGQRPAGWPRAGHVLSGRLKALAPHLRAIGIEVIIHKGNRGTRGITIRAVRAVGQTSATSATSATYQVQGATTPSATPAPPSATQAPHPNGAAPGYGAPGVALGAHVALKTPTALTTAARGVPRPGTTRRTPFVDTSKIKEFQDDDRGGGSQP